VRVLGRASEATLRDLDRLTCLSAQRMNSVYYARDDNFIRSESQLQFLQPVLANDSIERSKLVRAKRQRFLHKNMLHNRVAALRGEWSPAKKSMRGTPHWGTENGHFESRSADLLGAKQRDTENCLCVCSESDDDNAEYDSIHCPYCCVCEHIESSEPRICPSPRASTFLIGVAKASCASLTVQLGKQHT